MVRQTVDIVRKVNFQKTSAFGFISLLIKALDNVVVVICTYMPKLNKP